MKLILALIIALQSTMAFGVQVTIIGRGSCGSWGHVGDASWVEGYLSGIATGNNFLKGVDSAAATAWMANYCRANPLDSIEVAVGKLFVELDRRR